MVAIYLDGADLDAMRKHVNDVEGFTSNPTLIKKAGITSYKLFYQRAREIIWDKPISLEVLSDDWAEMEDQARELASWGDNVYVKIPIMNTKGESSIDLIDRLQDLRLNITAVMTERQIDELYSVVWSHHIVSVFAGRIQDADGALPIAPQGFKAKLLWASTRAVHDMVSAELRRFDIITMTPDLIAKLPLRGKDLHQYSLETVQQFYNDAKGITL